MPLLAVLNPAWNALVEDNLSGGAALPCSGGDLPLPGGETTGDKMIAFLSPPEFSFVKNMWRQFLICEQNQEI